MLLEILFWGVMVTTTTFVVTSANKFIKIVAIFVDVSCETPLPAALRTLVTTSTTLIGFKFISAHPLCPF